MIWILKVLVGSRAHGLDTEQSDYDYRGVFVQPTTQILSLLGHVQTTSWIEDKHQGNHKKEDDTGWEIGHFLKLALQCNPTILETFTAPVVESTPDGEALRALFPAIWDPVRVRDAFVGYGLNQRKKMLDGKDKRPAKYACAYLRTLVQAQILLTHGTLIVDMRTHPEYPTLVAFKNGLASTGQVVDKCREWEEKVETALKHHGAPLGPRRQVQDVSAVDAFLVDVRQRYWNPPVEEPGRPRHPVKVEITGSNPVGGTT